MPAAFVGHGSPMTAFEDNPYVEAWKALGERLPPGSYATAVLTQLGAVADAAAP